MPRLVVPTLSGALCTLLLLAAWARPASAGYGFWNMSRIDIQYVETGERAYLLNAHLEVNGIDTTSPLLSSVDWRRIETAQTVEDLDNAFDSTAAATWWESLAPSQQDDFFTLVTTSGSRP